MRFFLCLLVCQLVYMFSPLKIATQFVGSIEHIYFAGQDIESIKGLEGKPV